MSNGPFKLTDVTFTHVADMYMAELRKGNKLSLSHLVKAFPHLADDIQEQIPAMALIERAVGGVAGTITREDDLVGQEFAGCVVKREVGRGAVGAVYEAEQRGLGRRVAVKVIPLDRGPNCTTVERFELERKAMAQLDHPNIVPVFTYGHTKRYAYLVMRLIDGFSLYDLMAGRGDHHTLFFFHELQRNPQALAESASVIASALAHAHDQKLVHRDVKPGNLLLDTHGKLWLSDFGLAKVFDSNYSLSATGDVIGTPRYMAPEQLRGVCDARSDVYSLGITLFELASGQKVWEDQSALSMLTAKQTHSTTSLPELPEDFPKSLGDIIAKMCAFSPEDRYQTAHELKFVLDRFLAGRTPSDRRRGRRDPDDVFREKARRRVVIAATAAGIAACGIGIYFGLPDRPEPPVGIVATVPTTSELPIETAAATQPVALQHSPNPPSALNLIDKLADESEGDMVEIVTEYLQESIGGSGQQMAFSEQQQEELRQRVDAISKQIKTTGLTKESLNEFLEGYRQTSLPVATKVMQVSTIVFQSRLNDAEKQQAIQLLRNLARGTVAGSIPQETTIRLVNEMTGGLTSTAQIAAVQVEEVRLRQWLTRIAHLVAKANLDMEGQRRIVEEELTRVFEETFGSSQ